MKEKLGEILSIKTGKLDANASNGGGQYPFFTCSKEPLSINTYSYDCECVLVAGNGDLNVKYYNGKFNAYQRTYILESVTDKLYVPFLYYFMNKYVETLRQQSIGGVIKYIKLENITNAIINLPSFKQQVDICERIDKVKKILDKYNIEITLLDTIIKARFVEIFGDIKKSDGIRSVKLGSICDTVSGGTPSTKENDYYGGDIPWISTVALGEIFVGKEKAKDFITEKALRESATHLIPKDSIMVGTRVGVGKCSINSCDMCTNQDINSLINIDESKFNKVFLKFAIDEYCDYFNTIKKGATILGITTEDLKSINIPMVSLELQDKYVCFVRYIDKLKFDVQKSLEKTQMLFNTLVQEYFSN